MADTKTTDAKAGDSALETLFAMHGARPWPARLGAAKPTGDDTADARTTLFELDAIRDGASRDYSVDAREAQVLANARGEKLPRTMAEIDAALEGGRKALADREATRGTEAPSPASFNAMVQIEINKLLGIKAGSK